MEKRYRAGHLESLASLSDPVRRSLYEFVAGSGEPVSRDEATAAVGIARSLAAYHLDRLVEEGLLETHFERRSGKAGPGAGRPSKLYSRTQREIAVSLPARQYDLAAHLLAAAVEESRSPSVRRALASVAAETGRVLGKQLRAALGKADSLRRGRAALEKVLAEQGYEPYDESDGSIRMRNCPFHQLSATHTELVCGMNLSMMEGLNEAGGTPGYEPVLDPRPGECCVVFRPEKTS